MNIPTDREQILNFVLTDPKAATDLILDLYQIIQKQEDIIQKQAEKILELEKKNRGAGGTTKTKQPQ